MLHIVHGARTTGGNAKSVNVFVDADPNLPENVIAGAIIEQVKLDMDEQKIALREVNSFTEADVAIFFCQRPGDRVDVAYVRQRMREAGANGMLPSGLRLYVMMCKLDR